VLKSLPSLTLSLLLVRWLSVLLLVRWMELLSFSVVLVARLVSVFLSSQMMMLLPPFF
jgi:hypothetical protein